MNHLKLILATLVLSLAAISPASAQWKVFDPTNFVKNAVTAAQTTESLKSLINRFVSKNCGRV